MKTIAAIFQNRDQVRVAVDRLGEIGIVPDSVGIVALEDAPLENRVQEVEQDADNWAAIGTGTAAGGIAGWLAGAAVAGAAVTVPVVGPVLAIGAVSAAVTSAIGGTLGWLTGALVARGLSGQEAARYQTEVERGGILVTVDTVEDRETSARAILQTSGGQEYRLAA
jgi:hypothetical protein